MLIFLSNINIISLIIIQLIISLLVGMIFKSTVIEIDVST